MIIHRGTHLCGPYAALPLADGPAPPLAAGAGAGAGACACACEGARRATLPNASL